MPLINEFRHESAKPQVLHDQGKYKENVTNFLAGMGLPKNIIEDILNPLLVPV